MREIKFRGVTHEFSSPSWVYGDLICNSTDEPRIMDDYHDCYEPTTWLVDPETVGQFTTQTDNNGKDIYEGDILRVGSQVGTVVYDCDCFEVAFGCGNTSLFRCLLEKPCLVIGNIHDNPEFLEVEA